LKKLNFPEIFNRKLKDAREPGAKCFESRKDGRISMILIIDFGSQFNQLIARRVRESRVYCRIEPPTIGIDAIRALNPEGIILSGGPAGIYEKGSPKVTRKIFDLGIPVLGICYGLHFMADALGGKVAATGKREYGFAELAVSAAGGILNGRQPQDRMLDESRRFGEETAVRVYGYRVHRKHESRGHRRHLPEFLRAPVPPGSRSYPGRKTDAGQFPV
jgi:GMP synthase-like glutamine amidotransferase